MNSSEVLPKTTLPSVNEYLEVFQKCVDEDYEVVCICISSNLSGSYQSAVNAKKLLEKDSDKVVVIDSQQASCSQGLLVMEAVNLLSKYDSILEMEKELNTLKYKAKTFFTVDSLENLKKGGRINEASAFIGSLLNIKPTIEIRDGLLVSVGKTRGRKKAILQLIEYNKKFLGDHKGDFDFGISYVEETEDVEFLKEKVLKAFGEKNVVLLQAGITIATHTGSTLLGLSTIKK